MGNVCGWRRLSLAIAIFGVGAGGCGERALPAGGPSGSGGTTMPPGDPSGTGGTALPPGDPSGSGGSSSVTPGTGAFTLDLGGAEFWNGVATPPIISHNAAIVFPIDVSERRRVVTAMGPGTAIEAGTKATCASTTAADQVTRNVQGQEASLGPIPALGGRHVASVSLKMPYRIPADDYTRIAEGLCVLVRLSGSRDFTLVPGRTVATRDDAAQMASAVLPVDQADVDAIAVLSETTTAVSEITVDLR